MPTNVNFYLKKKVESTGECLIYLKFKYQRNVLVFTFGQTIEPGKKLKSGDYENWSTGRQRVKDTKYTRDSGKFYINDLLDTLQAECLAAYNKELKNGIPQPSTLKHYLVRVIQKPGNHADAPNLFKLIERFVSGEIKHKGRDKAPGTLLKYQTAQNYLKDFQTKTRYQVDFDTINLDFFYKYVTYLKGKGLSQNTISKQIDHIKTFMNEAFDQRVQLFPLLPD